MARYWVIAPVESDPPAVFDRVWQFDLANDVISIGWSKLLGDVSKMTREELAQAYGRVYPGRASQHAVAMIWNFYHEIRPGDCVVARRGRKVLAGVGIVTQAAICAPGKNPELSHPSFLGVRWSGDPRDKNFPTIVFPMQTVTEISEKKFRDLLGGAVATVTEDIEDEDTEVDKNEFALEKYLEEFIVENFDRIFKSRLKVYRDTEGNDGQQYATDVGTIDILAFEPSSGAFVVIELKKGHSSDKVVGQVLRYMGWVKRNLCKEGQQVKGLVVARDSDDKLTCALEFAPAVELQHYRVSFDLEPARG